MVILKIKGKIQPVEDNEETVGGTFAIPFKQIEYAMGLDDGASLMIRSVSGRNIYITNITDKTTLVNQI